LQNTHRFIFYRGTIYARSALSKVAEHQNEHELFIAQLSQLAQDVENKEADIENKTLDFLKDWYVAHILGADRDLEKSFQAKGFK